MFFCNFTELAETNVDALLHSGCGVEGASGLRDGKHFAAAPRSLPAQSSNSDVVDRDDVCDAPPPERSSAELDGRRKTPHQVFQPRFNFPAIFQTF